MHPRQAALLRERRGFLTSCAGGIGGAALASLLGADGLLANDVSDAKAVAPGLHFPAKAKSCIFIYLVGGPSQIDLYDPKPKLAEMAGETLPGSITGDERFGALRKDTARIMPSRYKFQKHGECGMELSELLPNIATCADDIALVRSMHTDAFNHHPGELVMNTGLLRFGYPSLGSWVNYGLGSENENLPGYVVLTAGTATRAGASNWSSGFLPSDHQGLLFRNRGEPVLHLDNPRGICPTVQGNTLNAVSRLNGLNYEHVDDPSIIARIQAYELAFRMQAAVPELVDFSDEQQTTFDEYGFMRPVPDDLRGWEGGNKNTYDDFARNCLMARRLVERGVRFVNVYHSSWDHHSLLVPNLERNCSVVDQPIAALLKDLKRQGLLDSTLVVCASEFGRTPLGENKLGNTNASGRDHQPFAFSLWLAGGGIQGGQTVGQTDEFGWNIVENPIHVHDLHATILHQFGIDHERLTYRFRGRDVRLTDISGRVISELLS
ncbi:MAG: DUF1501 domain-containing protein [Planctomycetaceae bacterium]|nr:DUF1501 domain-containing protein [Planctomycetaceae bacterium]